MIPSEELDRQTTEQGALLGRVAAGDREAFASLYDATAPLVLGVVTRMLGDRAAAEDVLQETYLQVWRQAGSFRAERGRPLAWILTIARSRALDRLRAEGARGRREEASARLEPAGAGDPPDLERLERDELRRQVARALGSLPAEQRAALELAFFGGLTHTQIAARLGAPLGTVKSRILLGMNKLRQTLSR